MICVSLREPDYRRLRAALKGLPLAEIRLDATRLSSEEVKSLFSLPLSLIATFRPGGAEDARRRETLSLAVRSGAKYVDLELESPKDFKRELTAIARSSGCKVIVSFHDPNGIPDRRKLEAIADRCRAAGADITKIACRVGSAAECSRLLSLYDRPEPMIALGLGRFGTVTRIVAPLLGAPFTYASLAPGSETGEGQLDWKTLQKRIEALAGWPLK